MATQTLKPCVPQFKQNAFSSWIINLKQVKIINLKQVNIM